MELEILGSRLLIKPDDTESVSKGGIIIPDTARKKSLTGSVVKIGVEVDSKIEIKEGTKVLFGEFSGHEVEIEDEVYYLIELKNIYGVIDE